MRPLAILLICLPALVHAEDARLGAIRSLLLPMRAAKSGDLKARGATPVFTTVKHQLRDWIESRLSVLTWNGAQWRPHLAVLQEQLNDELRRADLTCDSCPYQSDLGFLGPIVLEMKPGSLLVVRTAVGIQMCGYDESAYAYQAIEDQWRRFWQTEQNEYEDGEYFPQSLSEVLISTGRSEHLILTLGSEPWCSSNWHDVYYRIWQSKGPAVEPALLLDGREYAFIDYSIHGSVTASDVLMEYRVSSVEGGFTRPEIRHYVLQGGELERADPVAITPRNFTAWWLSHPSPENSRWSEEGSRAKLNTWQQQHRGPFAEFGFPTLHCRQQPDLWQVSTNMGEYGSEQAVYFLIRWRPPYRFTMVSAGDKPQPDCTEEDREADEPRSLFPDR